MGKYVTVVLLTKWEALTDKGDRGKERARKVGGKNEKSKMNRDSEKLSGSTGNSEYQRKFRSNNRGSQGLTQDTSMKVTPLGTSLPFDLANAQCKSLNTA